ncbi:MAG: helix-turn-helix domain-containing protein [Planctomycetota bacterium]
MKSIVAKRTDVTPPQIAAMLGVKSGKVLGWIRTGELEAWDSSINPGIGNPRWRVSIDALEAFRQRRMNTAITKPVRHRISKNKPTRQWV